MLTQVITLSKHQSFLLIRIQERCISEVVGEQWEATHESFLLLKVVAFFVIILKKDISTEQSLCSILISGIMHLSHVTLICAD